MGVTAPEDRRKGTRGANAVEYVFLLVFVMCAVALGYRTLASKVKDETTKAAQCLDGACSGGGSGGAAGGGGAAARGGGAAGGGGAAAGGGGAAAGGGGTGTSTGALTGGGAGRGGAAPASSQSTLGAIATGTGQFIGGAASEVWDGMIVGTYNAVRHPVDTINGLGYAIRNPGEAVAALRQQYTGGTGAENAGHITAAIVSTFGPGALARLGTAARVAETARAAGAAARTAEIGAAARTAEETAAAAAAARRARQAEQAVADARCPGGVCEAPGSCFAAGTPVTTVDGATAIEQVKAGDVVLARDPESGETVLEHVARTFVREASDTVDVELTTASGRHEHLTVTSEHPFHVHDKGFRAVAELAPGDLVDTATGTARVTALATLGVAMLVYNFEVEHAHTYFVGETTAWVHNACRPPAADFERSISRLPPGERVAEVRQMADRVATENNWTRDRNVERLNPGRTVYRDAEGNLYSVDTQHGRFEQLDRRGRHVGEINMDRQPIPGSQDPSGGHNLRVR